MSAVDGMRAIPAPAWPRGAQQLPAIVQDFHTGSVLMLGYMNEAAFEQTLASRRVTFFSRSRQTLWEKGETSGHYLSLRAIALDCDSDALLVMAEPHGPVCHLKTATCWGDAILPASGKLNFLHELESIIQQRVRSGPVDSYVRELALRGIDAAAQKLGEEAVESVIASIREDRERLIDESADLVFHLLIVLNLRTVPFDDIVARLAARHAQNSR